MSVAALDGIRLLSPQSQTDWNRYYQLRWQLLRKPWQQPPGSERDEFDDHGDAQDAGTTMACHIMAVDNNDTLIGVGRLHPTPDNTAQIRYMAVLEDRRRQKIGHKIITALESRAYEWGVQRITLNARNDFIGFYIKMDYQEIGPGQTLFNCIQHTRMQKQLIEK